MAPNPDPSTDVVIRTEALTKVYPGDVLAVDGLDLSVTRGEIFGLLGPNGAGKTTTGGMLTTRVIPTGGRAFVGGGSLRLASLDHDGCRHQIFGRRGNVEAKQLSQNKQPAKHHRRLWFG